MEGHSATEEVERSIFTMMAVIREARTVLVGSKIDYLLVFLLGLAWIAVIVAPQAAPPIQQSVASQEMVGDQAQYISAAQSFRQTGEFLDARDVPFTLFPVGLPIAGATLGLLVGLPAAFLLTNVVSMMLLALSTLGIARVMDLPRSLTLLSAFIVLSSPVLLEVSGFVWTEPAFAASVMLFIWIAATVLKVDSVSRSQLVGLVLTAGAATSFKYVGLVLIPTLGVVVWFVSRSQGWRALRISVVSMLAASVPTFVMVLRNLSLGAGPFGDRRPAYLRLDDAISSSLQEFGVLVLSPETSLAFRSVGVILAFVSFISIYWMWKCQTRGGYVLWAVFVGYWLLLWVSQASTHVDPTGPRFIMPMAAPIVLLTILWIRDIAQEAREVWELRTRESHTWVTGLSILVAGLWLTVNLAYLTRQ